MRSSLAREISVLTRDHMVRYQDSFKIEISLLDQLRDAFTSSKGAAGSSALKAHKAPYSFTAAEIYREIAEETEKRWRGRGRPALARTPLAEKIQDVAEHYEDPDELLALVRDWNQRIRACFRSYSELLGGCPECGEQTQEQVDPVDGSIIVKPVLVRVVGEFQAECKHCGASWEGIDGIRYLADHMKGVAA